MRALCGAIISAGALIALGLATLGAGARYQQFTEKDVAGAESGANSSNQTTKSPPARITAVKFSNMDTSLMFAIVFSSAFAVIGLAIAFLGLAFHHERRHRERMRDLDQFARRP